MLLLMNKYTKSNTNQVGSTLVIAIILIVVVAATGFIGYRIGTSQSQETSDSSSPVANEADVADEDRGLSNGAEPVTTDDWMLFGPTNSSDEYSVRAPEGLLPNGTCASGEILLGVIYNSDSYDYDCTNLNSALGYASIVFGTSSISVAPQLGAIEETTNVMLGNGETTAKKYTITAQEPSHGGPLSVRYVLYEADPQTTNQKYYAVYRTLVETSDEDVFLKDFEAAVMNGWTVPE